MKPTGPRVLGAFLLLAGALARADVKTVVERNDDENATAEFRFKNVPRPARGDAAARAKFTVVDGRREAKGGGADALNDGKLPGEPDQPAANFFFAAATDGGRVAVDLGDVIGVKQVNTYSWHAGARGPQVYALYASDGKAEGFDPGPRKGVDPQACGWKRIAGVDTRPKAGGAAEPGGQYGVSVFDSDGSLGRFRYLLFDVSRTEEADPFGNTFYSEIDVVDAAAPPLADAPPADAAPKPGVETIEADGGAYRITLDTSDVPDLTDWAHKELAPVVAEWYPKIVRMLPSEGFEAPKKFSITFHKDMPGVANTAGTRVNCAADWFRQNLKGEARGAVVHELVHVVQQYWGARRRNAKPNPGWLVEGIPDYIRWYKYEPQSRGAEITRRGLARARYDGSYRVSANFLNWVIETYDKDLIEHLNAAMRQGTYGDDLWKKFAGKSAPDLGDEWRQGLEKKLGGPATPATATAPAIK